MPIRTALTRALGIRHPIIQGGMHHVGFAPLAAAVSNAGGLGTITALTQPSPEALREEIRLCKSLTNEPFAVNLTLLPALAPPNYEEYAIVVEEEKIPCVETAGHFKGLEPFVTRFKKAGIFVIHKCVAGKCAARACVRAFWVVLCVHVCVCVGGGGLSFRALPPHYPATFHFPFSV
jgi:NADH:quinone reductase (non-electrogenic)